MLDNFDHIQASWFGEGWRAGQLALNAGADDFGGLLLEENVLYKADHRYATKRDHILKTIIDAGFTPVQRTTTYKKIAYPVLEQTIEAGSPTHERTHTQSELSLP